MRALLVLLMMVTVTAGSAAETVTPQFTSALPNTPGKQLSAVIVDYPPGAKSASHHHAASAFIYAFVLKGAIRSQLEGEALPRIYRAGESWFELPGAHHIVSENADAQKSARLLAIFIVSPGEVLTIPDTKEK